MKRFVKYGIVLGMAGCISGIAYAQMKPEAAIRARQSIMRVVALNFGPVSQMAQGKIAFNKEVFTVNALRLQSVWSMDVSRYFPAGSSYPFLTNLFVMEANRGYLVKLKGTSATVQVTGRPVVPRAQWFADSYNLVGGDR